MRDWTSDCGPSENEDDMEFLVRDGDCKRGTAGMENPARGGVDARGLAELAEGLPHDVDAVSVPC